MVDNVLKELRVDSYKHINTLVNLVKKKKETLEGNLLLLLNVIRSGLASDDFTQ